MFLPPEHGPENLGENNILALAAAAVEPSYIGWWSATAHHGFTTQKPMAVFVAVLRHNSPKVIEGSDVRFIKVTSRKFFGHQTYDVYGRAVSISLPAKTLVDCLDRPDLSGGPAELTRIAHSALGDIDPQELLAAATAMKSRAALQSLRFPCARALSFWNSRNRHASWIMPRRTRALPDRAIPFSRFVPPLRSGEPVSPP
jgi:predicted transcriptional regulator of viral defense system